MSEVAIDLSDVLSHFSGPEPESVAYLVTSLRRDGGEACKKLADQIEAKYAPPRIPEPEWGAIVREGQEGDRWIRSDKGWTNLDAVGPYLNWSPWEHFENPVLIREGLS